MIDTRIKKAWQDLFINKWRTLIVLVALVIGNWGIGSIVASYSILSRDLQANYISTQPPDLIIAYEEETETMDSIQMALPSGALMESRQRVTGRIEISPDRWVPLVVWVIEDFNAMKIALSYPQEAAWPPPKNSVLLERDAKLFSGLDINDQIQVRLKGQRAARTFVSGIAFDPGLAQSRMEHMVYAYITPETLKLWNPDFRKRRWVVRLPESLKQTRKVEDIAKTIQSNLKARQLANLEVTVNDAENHPHQFQLRSLLTLQGGIGLLAFLLSGVLVINLINALLASQIRQIGIMKSLGGRSDQIFLIYLSTIGIIGLVASLISIPLAVNTGFGYAGVTAWQLNFDILTEHLNTPTYLLLFALGLLLPITAAIWPIRRGTARTIREALTDNGTTSVERPPGFVEKFRLKLPTPILMAIRNGFRQQRRLWLIVVTLALGVSIILVALNVRASLSNTLVTTEKIFRHDVMIAFNRFYDKNLLDSFISKYEPIKTSETRSVLTGKIATKTSVFPEKGVFRFLDPDSPLNNPNLIAGTWLRAERPEGIVVNQQVLVKLPGVRVGDTIQTSLLNTTVDLQIIGVVKEFSPPAIYGNQRVIHDKLGLKNQANAILLSQPIRSLADQTRLITQIESDINGADWDVKQIQGSREGLQVIFDHLNIIAFALLTMAMFVLIIGGLGMASVMSISVMERSRELGVLRAIGAVPSAIKTVISLEGLLIAGLSWVLGLALSIPMSHTVTRFFGNLILEYPLDYRNSWIGLLLSLIVIILIALLASQLPASRSIRQPVRDALSYE